MVHGILRFKVSRYIGLILATSNRTCVWIGCTPVASLAAKYTDLQQDSLLLKVMLCRAGGNVPTSRFSSQMNHISPDAVSRRPHSYHTAD